MSLALARWAFSYCLNTDPATVAVFVAGDQTNPLELARHSAAGWLRVAMITALRPSSE
jgi:hypothetical protein